MADLIKVLDYSAEQCNDVFRKNITPYISHTYVADGDETPVTLAANTPTKYILNVTAKELFGFGVYDPGGANQALQLQVANIVDKLFKLDASSSIVASVNNVIVTLWLYREGVAVAGSVISRKITTGGDLGAFSVDSTFRASSDDLFDIYIEASLACNVTLSKTSIVINELTAMTS